MNEQRGEWFDPQELKSVSDIDFNYKMCLVSTLAKYMNLRDKWSDNKISKP